MRRYALLVLVMVTAFQTGCGARRVVADPETSITLTAALTEVGEGLAAMVKAQPESSDYGIYPAEFTVCFNVEASGSAGASLKVTPGSPALTPMYVRTGAEASVEESATRRNTVTIKFVNILFAPAESLVYHKSGEELYALRQAILGIDPRASFVPVQVTTAPTPSTSIEGVQGSTPAPPTPDPLPKVAPEIPILGQPAIGGLKFLSPAVVMDITKHIRAMPASNLRVLAAALNAHVGLPVLNPEAAEGELRQDVVGMAINLRLTKAEVQRMSGTP